MSFRRFETGGSGHAIYLIRLDKRSKNKGFRGLEGRFCLPKGRRKPGSRDSPAPVRFIGPRLFRPRIESPIIGRCILRFFLDEPSASQNFHNERIAVVWHPFQVGLGANLDIHVHEQVLGTGRGIDPPATDFPRHLLLRHCFLEISAS